MKKLIVFLLLPFFASSQTVVNTGNHRNVAAAAPTFVVKNTAHGTGTSSSIALPAFSTSLTNPSLIVVHQYFSANTFSAPTDTAGNTYLDCGPGQGAWNSSIANFECWYTLNTHTTASNVVTLHTSSSGSFGGGAAFEITGANTSSPIDGGSGVGYIRQDNATGGSSGANTLTCSSITPASNGDMIIAGFFANLGPTTAGTSPNAFTLFIGSGWNASEYFIQTTAAAISATQGDSTSSDPYGCNVIAIKH